MKIVDQAKRPKRNPKLTQNARQRDGYICQCCGGYGGEAHHIHPVCYGGADHINNLITLCRVCHKHAPDDPDEFLSYQRQGGQVLQSHITESLAQFRADKIKAAAEDGRPIPADSELEAAFQIEWQNARIFTYGMPPLNTLRFDNSPLHAKWLKRDRHTNEKWIDSAANDARRLVKFYSQFPESFYAICKSAECLLFLDAVPELKRRFGIAEQHIAKGD